ncbi:hypothetical protein EUTSA_v10029455mg [Eutrema salsugineum]|uniref:F-box domain-containing protein n=1 Tax=Eutrema salsugineum TaxID=72664 RepID=V4N0J3_EUTSA|nr:hypothetical protein EUTSA_v10029455mg [Eutrema salsugineum]
MGFSSIEFINYMPDEILHHVLSFHPIDLAIRTSVLSRRWRHVWCKTPCIDFANVFLRVTARKINQTLSSYRAHKIMSLNEIDLNVITLFIRVQTYIYIYIHPYFLFLIKSYHGRYRNRISSLIPPSSWCDEIWDT